VAAVSQLRDGILDGVDISAQSSGKPLHRAGHGMLCVIEPTIEILQKATHRDPVRDDALRPALER
jgi:hypothetical protein